VRFSGVACDFFADNLQPWRDAFDAADGAGDASILMEFFAMILRRDAGIALDQPLPTDTFALASEFMMHIPQSLASLLTVIKCDGYEWPLLRGWLPLGGASLRQFILLTF
jgi:hypothetical protein